MSDLDPRAYAVKLIERDRARIAAAVTRQLGQLIPRYQKLPEKEVAAGVYGVLTALQRFIVGEGERELLDAIEVVYDRRAAEGFPPEDLVLMTHAYLPVLRRFFCERSEDLRVGIAAYEEVESTALGLMRHLVVLALEARDFTDPGFTKKPESQSPPWPPMPVLVERVD